MTVKKEMLQCSLHYVDDGEQTRYCVRPAIEGKAQPLDMSTATNLSQVAADWPVAHTRTIEGTKEETIDAPTVPIYLGPVWLVGDEPEETLAGDEPAGRDVTGWIQPEGEDYKERFIYPYQVGPETHMKGPAGMDSILESGEFRVTGQVYFNPLKCFQPSPEIPSSLHEAQKDLISFEYVGPRGEEGFHYPSDHE